MHVNKAKGLYHCFGCGAEGDILSLMQELALLANPRKFLRDRGVTA